MILDKTRANIRRCGRILLSGGLVAFPTETVYGLGANALNPVAVAAIFRAKKRPRYDPLIVHIADPEALKPLTVMSPALSRTVRLLVSRFWPGPLTLVLPKSRLVPDIVTAGLPSVAIRMPCHPVALRLLREAGVPVAAPSANRFGRISPVTAGHVVEQLGEDISVLDAGRTSVGVESTILDLTGRVPVVLRPGGVALGKIAAVLKRPVVLRRLSAGKNPKAPGQLKSHYAPRTPLFLLTPEVFHRKMSTMEGGGGRSGFLCWKKPGAIFRCRGVRWLTQSGNAEEACRNLYAVLHELDEAGYAGLFVEMPPVRGLGLAVLDRLKRAQKKV